MSFLNNIPIRINFEIDNNLNVLLEFDYVHSSYKRCRGQIVVAVGLPCGYSGFPVPPFHRIWPWPRGFRSNSFLYNLRKCVTYLASDRVKRWHFSGAGSKEANCFELWFIRCVSVKDSSRSAIRVELEWERTWRAWRDKLRKRLVRSDRKHAFTSASSTTSRNRTKARIIPLLRCRDKNHKYKI